MRDNDILEIHPDCRELHLPLARSHSPAARELHIQAAGHGMERTRYRMRRRSPKNHRLLFTLGGRGWFELDGKKHPVSMGTAIFSPAGVPQHYGMDSGSWEILWFTFKPGAPVWGGSLDNKAPGLYPIPGRGEYMKAAVEGLKLALGMTGYRVEEFRIAYCRQIRILLERKLITGGPGDRQYRQRMYLRQMMDAVQGDPGRSWTVEELSELSGLYRCPDHFTRLCKKVLGNTPLRLVTEIRMQRAAELLTCTDYTLDILAGMLGYGSSYALSTAFKRFHGVSPADYRRQHAE